MENTSNPIIYAVNSDLDDGLLYAEFENKDTAIDYAKQHLDKLPFVDELEVSYDANGEIDNVFSYKTIWDHTMADQEAEAAIADTTDTEDAYWDFKGDQEVETNENKYDIGDTTWFESMNNLVEEMEENENMVECKECFDLFPKTNCIKIDCGYVCPTCHNKGKVFTVSDNEIFNVDFPEYEKFSDDNNPEFVNEPEMDQIQPEVVEVENDMIPADTEKEITDGPSLLTKEILDQVETDVPNDPAVSEDTPPLTPEKAVPFLVNDEIEAVAGYEKAAEVVADSDLENKEEILDIIEHIKEEEEEHIEELQDLVDDEIVEVENDPSSTEEVEETEKPEEELVEHINDRDPAIESDQELEGTDNAVVDCKVADVVSHSEDEKPVDCEGKKKPLEKPLTEGFTFSLNNEKDLTEFTQLCQEVGIKTISDLDRFTKETAGEPGNILDKLRSYRKELGDDFEIKEELNLQYGLPQIKSIATFVHTAVNNLTKDNRVGTRQDGTSFYVLSDKRSANPEQIKKTIVDTLAKNGYDPEVVQYVDKGQVYGFVVDKIRATSRMSLKYENLTEGVKFTEEEQEEFNMDEDGNSLDSYDTYVRCGWCDEIFTKDQCDFEANMGWLCDRCQSAITSRGERLTLITNPTEEDEARVMTEDVELDESAILAAAASGIIVDVVKRIFDKFGDGKKKSKWIDFRKYIIEKTPEGQINIWNLDGEQVESNLKTVKAAKEKIKLLPKPKKVKADPKKDTEQFTDKDEKEETTEQTKESTEA